jgi:hypothetical protein
MLLSGREAEFSPHPPAVSVLGLQPVLRTVLRCLRSEPASPFWAKQEEKIKFLFAISLLVYFAFWKRTKEGIIYTFFLVSIVKKQISTD